MWSSKLEKAMRFLVSFAVGIGRVTRLSATTYSGASQHWPLLPLLNRTLHLPLLFTRPLIQRSFVTSKPLEPLENPVATESPADTKTVAESDEQPSSGEIFNKNGGTLSLTPAATAVLVPAKRRGQLLDQPQTLPFTTMASQDFWNLCVIIIICS